MKRPLGVTILCVVLGFLAVCSVINTYLDIVNAPIFGTAFSLLIQLYGLTALVASIGLWKLRRWSYKAFLAWAMAAILLGIYTTPRSFAPILWAHLAMWAGICFILWLLARYVRKVAYASDPKMINV